MSRILGGSVLGRQYRVRKEENQAYNRRQPEAMMAALSADRDRELGGTRIHEMVKVGARRSQSSSQIRLIEIGAFSIY